MLRILFFQYCAFIFVLFYLLKFIFKFFRLHRLFTGVHGLSLAVVSRVYSSCGAQASHVAEHRLQGSWAQQLHHSGSGAQTQQLWCTGLVALQHVGSSRTRDQTHVPALQGGLLVTVPSGKPCFKFMTKGIKQYSVDLFINFALGIFSH